MFVGEVLIYLVGVPWLAVDLHVGLGKDDTWQDGHLSGDAAELNFWLGGLPSASAAGD